MKTEERPKYTQIVSKHGLKGGTLSILDTFVLNAQGEYEFDERSVSFNGRDLSIPRAWQRQTSSTICRKVAAIIESEI